MLPGAVRVLDVWPDRDGLQLGVTAGQHPAL
jgi:hypothetical protein